MHSNLRPSELLRVVRTSVSKCISMICTLRRYGEIPMQRIGSEYKYEILFGWSRMMVVDDFSDGCPLKDTVEKIEKRVWQSTRSAHDSPSKNGRESKIKNTCAERKSVNNNEKQNKQKLKTINVSRFDRNRVRF